MKKILILGCALVLLIGCITMSSMAATTKTGYCQACKTDVTWEPVVFGEVTVPEGQTSVHKHYYFTEDKPSATQLIAKAGVTLCVDLCGKDVTFRGRGFLNYQATEAAPAGINIQDSEGGATVTSYSHKSGVNDYTYDTNNTAGGMFWVDNYCTVNIYGGTYIFDNRTPSDSKTLNGGIAVVYPGGTFNVYNATLNGGVVASQGGCIDVQDKGSVLLHNTIVSSGSAATGPCINVQKATCKVTLSGNSQVDEIYYHYNNTASLAVSGAFTGQANISYNTANVTNLAVGTAVGSLENSGSVTGDLYCTNGSGYSVVADGTTLKLAATSTAEVRYECPHCKQPVKWVPFTPVDSINAGTHHFYLDKNYSPTSSPASKQVGVIGSAQVCLDLNGYSYETDGRAFYTSDTAVLSIVSTKEGGQIVGTSGTSNPGGGSFSVSGTSTLNLYSGTLKFLKDDVTKYGTGRGGVILSSSKLNIYGGKIVGGDMVDSTYESFNTLDGVGGAIYASGTLNILGGEILSGTVPASGAGPCIYFTGSTSKLTLGGNAEVEDIYFVQNNSANFIVNSDFTGTANLSYPKEVSLYQGLAVGKCDAKELQGSISCTGQFPTVLPMEGNLVLSVYPLGVVAATGGQGFTTLQAALDAAQPGALVEILKSSAEDLSVSKNLCLQLNGCSITGTVTVAEGCTLYGMDSSTDDYSVSDDKYGKLTKVVGNVAGVSVDHGISQHSYIMVNQSGTVSFHCVALQIYAMSLRVTDDKNEPGLYYKSHFLADEIAAPLLTSYGVALSAREYPNAQNLETKCSYSVFTNFESGPNGNLGNASSTLLKGIMKNSNADIINGRNLSILVYGRAYAKTADGQILFGEGVSRSLADQLEGIDAIVDSLSSAQTKAVTELYHQFKSILQTRGLTNIAKAYEQNETGTLKVLVLGNSHGLDATNLLYEVFYQERLAGRHDQDVLIAALYYSGCSVNQHYDFLQNNQKVYTYHKNSGTKADRSWTVVEATCLDALRDEQWDVILMQQMNTTAADERYYKAQHWKYVADYLQNNQDNLPTLGFHVTWANPDDYALYLNDDAPYRIGSKPDVWREKHETLWAGADGKYDQDVMYAEIMRLTQKYLVDSTDWLGNDYFDERYIMGSATAVHYAQNIRGRDHEDIYRDYTHMNDYGRLICAYQWYAQLMGLEELTDVNTNVIPKILKHPNSKYPSATDANGNYIVDDGMKADLIASVNWTLKHPFCLSESEN